MSKDEEVVFDEDNPEWTEADFARARPISDFPELAAAFPNTKQRTGLPFALLAADGQEVTLRLPKSVIEHFKAGGPGWQTRAIAVLEREVERARS